MLSITSFIVVAVLSQRDVDPSFCLVFPREDAGSEFIRLVPKLKKRLEVEALSTKWSYHLVDIQPGLVAVLPNHTKLEKFIDTRRAVLSQAISDRVGVYAKPVGYLAPISSIAKVCRESVVPAMRNLGLEASDSTLLHFEVDATLRLSLGKKLISVPFSRTRRLSKEAEAEGRNFPTKYDRDKVAGAQDTLAQAVAKRPNVEVSTDNIALTTWGEGRTNSRIASFAQLALKQLSDEYQALEQKAIRDELAFAASLSEQGADWKALGASVGKPVNTLPKSILLDLGASLYSNATASGLTDQASVDRYLQGATITSVRYSITCFTFAKFADGQVMPFGVGLL
jgi:hypothetical protein